MRLSRRAALRGALLLVAQTVAGCRPRSPVGPGLRAVARTVIAAPLGDREADALVRDAGVSEESARPLLARLDRAAGRDFHALDPAGRLAAFARAGLGHGGEPRALSPEARALSESVIRPLVLAYYGKADHAWARVGYRGRPGTCVDLEWYTQPAAGV